MTVERIGEEGDEEGDRLVGEEMGMRWRQAAIDAFYDAQPRVGASDTNPEPYVGAAADAAVRVVLEGLRDIAAEDGNLDDRLWFERFTELLDGIRNA